MINFEEENDEITPEIQQELVLITKEAESLESDLLSFKSIYEELKSLQSKNEDLEKRLSATETNAETNQQALVENFGKIIKQRDAALNMLLVEVKNLHAKMREIHNVIKPNT
jgi:predicted  nucleic acid-binding Zn-ribbon protein